MNRTVQYESLESSRKVVVLLFLLVSMWYLTWRLGTLNPHALLFSWLLYLAELYGFATTLMHLFMTWRLTVRQPPPPPQNVTVDVFIPTINESPFLVRRTLLAALNIEYPHVTWLLDDGRRPEMEALAKELGCRYLVRPDNRDAKAGNLNHALQHSAGEFVVVFDADHAPQKTFLTRTLGYFRDRYVAFVQTPQDFYNLDSFQHHNHRGAIDAWHEQSVFFRIIQRGKDHWNSAFFCGSCAVIRRTALEAVGGFATGTVTEDLHTSLKIHKQGYRSVYHAETLAFGLAPSEVTSFLKQRIRWGQGAMQVWRKEAIIFAPELTIAQRINYVASSITYFDGWQKGFFYLIPAIVLVSGVMPLVGFGRDFLIHFVPYFMLTFWCFEEVGRGYGRSLIIEQFNMARFAALAWSTLAVFKNKIKFFVTPKLAGPAADVTSYVMPQACIMAANLLGIATGLFLYYRQHHLPQSALIANVIWALVNSGLAITVLHFIFVHAGHHRKEYRFPIPLPAIVKFPSGSNYYGTIDDISAAGFRIYSGHPEECLPGTKVTGSIFLPSVAVDFVAEIKTRIMAGEEGGSYVKSIGCSFLRSRRSELDQLDLFLYGSGIQLNIHRLKESISTPLGLLQNEFGRLQDGEEQELRKWSAVAVSVPGDSHLRVGLLASRVDGKAPAEMLLYNRFPEGTPLKAEVYGRSPASTVTGSLGKCSKIETPLAPLYRYQFIPAQVVTHED